MKTATAAGKEVDQSGEPEPYSELIVHKTKTMSSNMFSGSC